MLYQLGYQSWCANHKKIDLIVSMRHGKLYLHTFWIFHMKNFSQRVEEKFSLGMACFLKHDQPEGWVNKCLPGGMLFFHSLGKISPVNIQKCEEPLFPMAVVLSKNKEWLGWSFLKAALTEKKWYLVGQKTASFALASVGLLLCRLDRPYVRLRLKLNRRRFPCSCTFFLHTVWHQIKFGNKKQLS